MKGSLQYGILITLVVFLNINFPTFGQEKSSPEGLGWKTTQRSATQFSQSFTQDTDNDGLVDAFDNCPTKANSNQLDTDKDGIGDVCDGYQDSFSLSLASAKPNVLSISPEYAKKVVDLKYNTIERGAEFFSNVNGFDYVDFNKDGYKDLIQITNAIPELGHIIGIFLWDQASESFKDDVRFLREAKGDAFFHDGRTLDINGDGLLDVFSPSHGYHGVLGNQPDYYFKEGWMTPANILLNTGSGFNRIDLDTTSVIRSNADGTLRKEYMPQATGSIIDFDGDGIMDLLLPANSDPLNQNTSAPSVQGAISIVHAATNYYWEQNQIKKRFKFKFPDDFSTKSPDHSTIFKTYNGLTYFLHIPTFDNTANGSIPNTEIWIYEKKLNAIGHPILLKKIKLQLDPKLNIQNGVMNYYGFHITDLDQDGKEEFILGMFTEPIVNGLHAGFHVFDSEGNELTRKWFSGEEYLDNTGAHGTGFHVVDFNNDGFTDFLVTNRHRSSTDKVALFMNTGRKFILIHINTGDTSGGSQGWSIPVDVNNDKIFEIMRYKEYRDWTFQTKPNITLYSINFQNFHVDIDQDKVLNSFDNCPTTPNSKQEDRNGNGIGDYCDDPDQDALMDIDDPCPDVYGLDKGCPDTKAPTLVLKSSHTLVLPASGTSTLEASTLNNGSTDNVGITQISLSKTSFTCADLGVNKITFTAKDASGNTSSAEVTVTVVDEIKPILKAKASYTIKLDAEGKAALKWEDLDEGSIDNCSIKDKLLSKTSFTCADLGVNKITFTAKDASGNTSSAEVTVTVVDEIKPILKAKASYTIKLDADGKGALKWEDLDEGSSDNCSIKDKLLSKTSFTCADLGTNKVTFTAKDATGNTSSAEVTVIVVDEIKPILKAKAAYTIKLDVQGKATLKWDDIDEGSSDNCSIKERKLSKTEFSRTDGGDNKVTYTITDASGNTSSIDITVRVDIVLSTPERPLESNTLKAYPNPVNDYLNLEFAEGVSSIRTSSLVDASGKVIGELNLEEGGNGQLGFSTRNLKNGMYFLRLGTRDTLHLIKFTVIH